MTTETDTNNKPAAVGQMIYDLVNTMMSEDSSLTRTQAFEAVAEQQGRRAGTVAANYYRVARNHDDADIASRTPSQPPTDGTADDLLTLLDEAVDATREVQARLANIRSRVLKDAREREALRASMLRLL